MHSGHVCDLEEMVNFDSRECFVLLGVAISGLVNLKSKFNRLINVSNAKKSNKLRKCQNNVHAKLLRLVL